MDRRAAIKRAYSDQEKLAKRQKIIDAAEILLVKGMFPLPSVNQIIAKAGVAKGTVYLYFSSKEEIYLSLLAQYFDGFTSGFIELLEQSKQDELIDNFSAGYIGLAKQQPKAVYLSSIVPLILENNVGDEYLVGFKKSLYVTAQKISNAMAFVMHSDRQDEFLVRFLHSHNLFLASWQHCNPPSHVKDLMSEHGLDGLIYNFEIEFRAHMHRLWADLI